jgi:hypothetical protein
MLSCYEYSCQHSGGGIPVVYEQFSKNSIKPCDDLSWLPSVVVGAQLYDFCAACTSDPRACRTLPASCYSAQPGCHQLLRGKWTTAQCEYRTLLQHSAYFFTWAVCCLCAFFSMVSASWAVKGLSICLQCLIYLRL